MKAHIVIPKGYFVRRDKGPDKPGDRVFQTDVCGGSGTCIGRWVSAMKADSTDANLVIRPRAAALRSSNQTGEARG